MFLHDKERLIVSVFIAVGIHGLLVVGAFFVDWGEAEPFEYTGPVYVELQEQDLPEPPPEEALEEPEEEAELEPEPAETVETEIKDPETQDAAQKQEESDSDPAEGRVDADTASAEEPETAPPAAEPSQAEAEAGRSPADTGSNIDEGALAEMKAELAERPERVAPVMPDSTIPDFDFTDPDISHRKEQLAAIEDWIKAYSEEDRSSEAAQDGSNEAGEEGKSGPALDPEALAKLDKALDGLDKNKSTTLRTEGPGTESQRDEDTDKASPPEGADVPMVGEGRWRTGGKNPDISARDFGGNQPPLVTVIVTFMVNESGKIVPASLKIEKSSGYTTVDNKISDAVTDWTFMRDDGAADVKGEMTFIIKSSDL